MIELAGVGKRFGEIEALRDVTMEVNKGSVFGLVGSNGAGKTTLLKILSGIYRQDLGQVRIDSQNVYENNRVKERTFFIPDYLYFFHNYTIDNMAQFYRSVYKTWDQERYVKLSGVFDLDAHRRIKTLSKGMQRQVAFWLGLSLAPDVMILDEPLDGLDPVMRHKVKNLIFQDVAGRQMTVMISSHNLRELEGICDYVGILHRGSMLVQKEMDDLKADLNKVQIGFSDGIPEGLLRGIQILHQEQRGRVLILVARGDREELISQLQAFQPSILDVLPLTLEEIFIYEMGDNGYEIKNVLNNMRSECGA
ncbi:MAG: ABC transporter ATP-binding protein [Syntrophomonadaceae bacterium]